MKDFEQYDLGGWIENGLSVHPEPLKPAPERIRHARGFLTRLAIPFMALGTVGVSHTWAAQSVVGPATFQTITPQGQLLVTAQSSAVTLRVSDGHASTFSAVDEFQKQAAALLAEVRAGALTNVSPDTLKLATELTNRHAATTDPSDRPDWVDKVATEVAKLTD